MTPEIQAPLLDVGGENLGTIGVRGMSRPLLKLGGGSGEILCDVLD